MPNDVFEVGKKWDVKERQNTGKLKQRDESQGKLFENQGLSAIRCNKRSQYALNQKIYNKKIFQLRFRQKRYLFCI